MSNLSNAIDDYLAECAQLEPNTLTWYTQKLGVFNDWCTQTGVDLSQVNNRNVVKFQTYLKHNHKGYKGREGLAPQTVHGYVQVVKSFVSWCAQDEEHADNVHDRAIRGIRLPEVEAKVIETFTKDQIEALYEACDREYNSELSARDKMVLDIYFQTGLRSNELLSLTIENIFLTGSDPRIRINGKKTHAWRELALSPELVRKIRRYLSLYRNNVKPSDYLVVSRSGEKMNPGGMTQLFERLGIWAHIQGVRCTPHTCRHTFAVNFLMNGGDVYVLQRLLGHTTVTMTERYLSAFKDSQARTIQRNMNKKK